MGLHTWRVPIASLCSLGPPGPQFFTRGEHLLTRDQTSWCRHPEWGPARCLICTDGDDAAQHTALFLLAASRGKTSRASEYAGIVLVLVRAFSSVPQVVFALSPQKCSSFHRSTLKLTARVSTTGPPRRRKTCHSSRPSRAPATPPSRAPSQVLKAVVAKYNAEELLSKRESVSTRIRDELTHRAKQFHLIMDDVSITHLTFGHEFTKAIENKQVRGKAF